MKYEPRLYLLTASLLLLTACAPRVYVISEQPNVWIKDADQGTILYCKSNSVERGSATPMCFPAVYVDRSNRELSERPTK